MNFQFNYYDDAMKANDDNLRQLNACDLKMDQRGRRMAFHVNL